MSYGQGSDDIANQSTVVGAFVSDALETLDTGGMGFPPGYIDDLQLTFRTVATIDIEPGDCRDDADSIDMSFGSSVTLTLSASGAGGLDTGVEASSTLYYVWAIDDSTDVNSPSGIYSLSDTSPTLPSGYDKKRLIGAVRNDSSSNLFDFTMRGTGKARSVFYNETTATLQVLSSSSATSFTNVDVSAVVPSFSQRIITRCSYQRDFFGDPTDFFSIRPDGSTVATPSTTIGEMFDDFKPDIFNRVLFPIELSSSQIFEFKVADADNTLQLFLVSYEFEL